MAGRRGLRRAVLAAVTAALLVGLSGCDWLQPRFDPARTGNNPASGLSTSNVSRLLFKWVQTASGVPVVANGVVLAGNVPGGTVAFNASDGTFRWASTPVVGAVDRNTVYGLTGPEADGSAYALHALSLSSGTDEWSVTAKAGGGGCCGASILAAVNGKVYVMAAYFPRGYCCPTYTLDVWDTSTQRVAWTTFTVATNPAIANGVVYYLGFNLQGTTELFALDAQTGKQLWSQPKVGSCSTDTFVSSGYVFSLGATYRAQDGAFVASWPRCVQGTPAVAGTNIFGIQPSQSASPDQLVSFDGVSGAVHWSYGVGTEHFKAPTIANNVVLVSNSQGIIAFETATGRPVGLVGNLDFPTDPIVAAGTVYTSTGNKLYALVPG